MNRFLKSVSIAAVSVIVPAVGVAQTPSSPVTVALMGGAAMPMGDLADGAKIGFTFGGGVEFGASTLPFGLRAEIAYNRFGEESQSVTDPDLGTISGAIRVSNLNLNLNAVLAPTVPAAQIRPYAIAGVGFYNSTYDVEFNFGGTSGEVSDDKGSFGLNGGAGVRFQFVGFSSFIEARYHHVFKVIPEGDFETEETTWKSGGYLPIVFGISIGG